MTKQKLKFVSSPYFPNFLKNGAKLMDALCSLVADLQADRDYTISHFLDHAGSEDFIWSILKLLGFQNDKIAGNAAYVIGTLADTSSGSERLICLVSKSGEAGNSVLDNLLRLLELTDDEIILNGVGALGSLADSDVGRNWICNAKQFEVLLGKICSLLRHKNVWIGSNSALLLARLTILDAGLSKMLVHTNAREICVNLVTSLGSDAAGRGMNAAFALGRIVDVAGGQELISVLDEDLHRFLVKALSKMLEDRDVGTAKNALYAMSCLAGQKTGSQILARNKTIENIAKHLTDVLLNDMADNELRWFCAMTLRSFACQQKTCLELKKLPFVYNSCRSALRMANLPEDIKEELIDVFEYLKPLPQMLPPRLELTGPLTIKCEWDEVKLRGPFQQRYSLYHITGSDDLKQIYSGPDLRFSLTDLKAYSLHTFRIRIVTDHEEGPLSEPVSIRTEEWLPGQVRNLHMIGHTATQIKVAWDEPLDTNGIIRHYVLYLDDGPNRVGKTEENYYILQNLNQNNSDRSSYTVHVAAVTGRGEGLRQSLEITTADVGDCRPSKPTVNVLGRTEVYVTWSPPTNTPGKIIRYELTANDQIVYSGTELYANVKRLEAETEYIFQVTLFSNEGHFHSLTTKKSTLRDEFTAFNGPRTASSKGNRSAKGGRRKNVAPSAVEIQTDQSPEFEALEINLPPPPATAPEFLKKPPTPPPKPFSRSKTMVSANRASNSRKSSSLRRGSQQFVRRSLPPVVLSSVTQPLPVNFAEKKPNTPPFSSAAIISKDSSGSTENTEFKIRERSSTTGSKSSDNGVREALSTARQRRNRSQSMVNKLLITSRINTSKQNEPHFNSTPIASASRQDALKTPGPTQPDVKCSVVTLNLPNDVIPPSVDYSNKWAYGLLNHRAEMISASMLNQNDKKGAAVGGFSAPQEPLRRAATILQQQFTGNSVLVTQGAPSLGQRGLTVYTDSARELMTSHMPIHCESISTPVRRSLPSMPRTPQLPNLAQDDIAKGRVPTSHPTYAAPSNCSPPRLYLFQHRRKTGARSSFQSYLSQSQLN